MATLIGDYATEPSRFHTMIATPGLQYNQQHSEPPHYRSTSRSREAPSRQQSSSSPARSQRPAQASPSSSSPSSSSASTSRYSSSQAHSGRESALAAAAEKNTTSSSGGASRFPSPPDSSSPSGSATSASRSVENLAQSQHGIRSSYMDSTAHDFAQEASSSASTQSTITAAPPATTSRGPQAIPSPASDAGAPWTASQQDLSPTEPQTQTTIRVRDLAHIQSLARADLLSGNGPGILNDPPLQAMKYEISGMPISDIIEMVAALLTKITTTNDLQHDALNRNANHVKQAQAQNEGSAGENHMSPMSSSVLAFHGKNVPAITILSYLSRIHKYCPTTYEVFLSLLVYFDRMTERVNDIVMKAEEARRSGQAAAVVEQPQVDVVMRDETSHVEDETDEDLADDSDDDQDMGTAPKPASDSRENAGAASEATRSTSAPINQQATFFVVDSFNIHRLIIAGVTCASKFFSDVFYTNSRYAKVGGLPLAELNHLELQFLLLNDFRLAVPVEDLEAYATMLVEFYAREVVAQRSRPVVTMD